MKIRERVGLSPKKMGAFHLHHLGQILTNTLSDIYAGYPKKLFRILLNLLENTNYLWYTYLHFHGRFSSLSRFCAKTLLKEKHLFPHPF